MSNRSGEPKFGTSDKKMKIMKEQKTGAYKSFQKLGNNMLRIVMPFQCSITINNCYYTTIIPVVITLLNI